MFKKAARTTSFKNVCQTLCKHHQRLHAYNLYCNSTFTAVTIETGKGKSNSVVCHLVFNWGGLLLQQLWFQTHHHWVMLHSWIPSYQEWWHMNYTGNTVTLFCLLIINFDCLFVDWCKSINILGTSYKADKCWMMVGKQDIAMGTMPQFGLLCDIIVYGSQPTVIFIFKVTDTTAFVSHFRAYELSKHPHSMWYFCVFTTSLKSHEIYQAVYVQNTCYLKPKHDLTVLCNYV